VKTRVWRVEDDGEAQLSLLPKAESGLVSLPFLVAAVRRKWRLVVATAGVCALLALGLSRLLAGQPAASVTLLVISDPTVDPSAAMTTNLSLLQTRTLSQQVVTSLHLPLTPAAFGATVTGGVLSDQLMTVTVTAPSSQEAIQRANKLAPIYLNFRAQQLSASADSSIRANQERIDSLNSQIENLTAQADRASASGKAELATTLTTQRAQLQGVVSDAEQETAQTKIQNEAIVHASHVVDSAAVVEKSRRRSTVLAVMSGLVGGTALGLGLVLVPAVLSVRLRRRDDVARALGLPVSFSAGAVHSRWWVPGRESRRNADTLAHGLGTALSEDTVPARLTLATVGDVRDGAYVVGALADELARESTRVAVVDLSSSSALARPWRFRLGRRDPVRNRQLVTVHRLDVRVSELTAGKGIRSGRHTELGDAEVVLTLIELDLGTGIDVLGDLAESAVVLVSAGLASAERLRSTAALLRQSDIQPVFAMLADADATDDSSGVLEAVTDRGVSTRRSS
jgi:capsular polysaccharide biosynthesis protein